jgi:hypothetical protein
MARTWARKEVGPIDVIVFDKTVDPRILVRQNSYPISTQ